MSNNDTPPAVEQLDCPQGMECPYYAELLELRNSVTQLQKDAHTDALTGLYNNRHFQISLRQEIERTQRTGQPTTLVLVDLDFFKKINDTWGHVAGDAALKHIALILQNSLRKLDVPCRYGGEEFAILLPSTPLLVAVQVAERLRTMIANNPLSWEEKSIPLTASFGVDTLLTGREFTPEKFVASVDHWLYEAKKNGRNRVQFGAGKRVTKQMVSAAEKNALNDLQE